MDMQHIVEHLVKMGNDPRTNEAEAANALSKAASLMARYNIQLGSGEEEVRPKVVSNSQRFDTVRWERVIASVVRVLYPVDYIIYGGDQVGFVGTPVALDAAHFTFSWLCAQVELFYKQALPKGLTKQARAEFRRTFKEACALRTLTRARQIMADMVKDDASAKAATGSRALVVIQSDQLARQAVTAHMSGLGLKMQKSKPLKLGSGTAAGFNAAQRVQLRQEV